ncbi:universal stress protein [Tropicimonas sediminicola]|uniref:Nucleotide-binding universal stress protein, UspA family n=1 Tax=Tropicimonas sediminicola TaxID=1031541 RepID=A0A239DH10_9RHOB|nr:universal stress protein [Tropicimonas sediminicola]SNS31302.1 Nucleotide-binding universal stress protein, UspA family [Tropicimonas sediminicola]
MFANVLLPIDLNHPASWTKALPMAVKLCGSEGTLHVLGIVHDLGSAMISSFLPADFEKRALQQMKEQLDTFCDENVPEGTSVVVHVEHGHVPEHLLHAAKQVGADLIVMASHPPDDLQTMLVGSNAEKVVRHASIPVMVVR